MDTNKMLSPREEEKQKVFSPAKEMAEKKEKLEKFLEEHKSSAAMLQLGRVYHQLGDHLKGEELIQKAYEKDDKDWPQFAENRRLAELDWQAFAERGLNKGDNGNGNGRKKKKK